MKKRTFVYCRKSSDREDKQVLSIPAQKLELKQLYKTLDLDLIGDPIEETKTAKVPGREKFNNMLDRVENGEGKNIFVWHVDRLSRNSVDTGRIIYLMDSKKLEEVITPSQTFKNTPNDKFLLNLLCSQAKLENDNKGINAKLGMNMKAGLGWWPQNAPTGYINTPEKKKGLKTIEIDPELFPVVKKCFKEVINGRTAMSVYKQATEEWGLVNPKTGKPVARSTFYKMLNNPFYFGEFFWSGKWYIGKHEPMITREEFDVVQRMLGKKGKPVQRKQTFDLTGLFRCQQCGCAITATRKEKYFERTKNLRIYTYYHCTKKRQKYIKCKQTPIDEENMTKEIIKQLLQVQPPVEFIHWAKKWVGFLHQNESEFQEDILKNGRRQLTKLDQRLNKLLDLYIDEDLDKKAYEDKKRNLEAEKLKLEHKLDNADEIMNNWRIKVEDAIDFADAVATKFHDGLKEEKHQILIKISSDLLYKSKNPLIQLKNEYQSLKEIEKAKERPNDVARTSKYADLLAKNPDLVPANSTWLPREDSNLQPTG